MAERYPSHYSELVGDVVAKEAAHTNGIAITVIPSLMERTDGLGVFEEGAVFRWNTRERDMINLYFRLVDLGMEYP